MHQVVPVKMLRGEGLEDVVDRKRYASRSRRELGSRYVEALELTLGYPCAFIQLLLRIPEPNPVAELINTRAARRVDSASLPSPSSDVSDRGNVFQWHRLVYGSIYNV